MGPIGYLAYGLKADREPANFSWGVVGNCGAGFVRRITVSSMENPVETAPGDAPQVRSPILLLISVLP